MFTGSINGNFGAYHVWFGGEYTPPAERDETVYELEGKPWELGVLVPFKNVNFDYFEKQFQLLESIEEGDTTFKVYGDLAYKNDIFPHQLVFIGPSSNTFRGSQGNFLYKDYKEEKNVVSLTYNFTDYDSWYTVITVDTPFIRRYNRGDNVTFRGLAKGWKNIYDEHSSDVETIISDVDGAGSVSLNTKYPKESLGNTMSYAPEGDKVQFFRTDPIFDYKGHAQRVYMPIGYETRNKFGFRQSLSRQDADYFHKLIGKYIRFSGWYKTQFATEGAVDVRIGFVFYNNIEPSRSNEISYSTDNSVKTVTGGNEPRWLRKVVVIPALSKNGCIYAFAQADENVQQMNTVFEYVLAEHAIGTCQEDEGYYTLHKTPKIGVSVDTNKRAQNNRLGSGDLVNSKVSNPSLRISFDMQFDYVDENFVDDMKVLEDYSNNGDLIVLRTNTFESLPPVLIGKIKLDEPEIAKFSRGGILYHLKINFREVIV